MKRSIVLAALLWPAVAFGQQLYTNADLTKFDVPGAYTNEDLSRLSPLAVQKTPAATLPPFVRPSPAALPPYQEAYDSVKGTRDAFAYEMELEQKRVEFSESPFAGYTDTFAPRLGYRTQVADLILELRKRIALLDYQMRELVDQARRAGVTIDQR